MSLDDRASCGRGDGDRGVHLRLRWQSWVLLDHAGACAMCNDNVWRFSDTHQTVSQIMRCGEVSCGYCATGDY